MMEREKLLKPTLVSIHIRSDIKEKMNERRVEPLRPRNQCRLSHPRLIDTVSPNDTESLAPFSSSVDLSQSGDKAATSRTGQFTKVLGDRRRRTNRSQSDGSASVDSKVQSNSGVLTQSLQQASVWFGQQRIYQTAYNPFDYANVASSTTSQFIPNHTKRNYHNSDLNSSNSYPYDDLPVPTNSIFPMSKSLPKPHLNSTFAPNPSSCATVSPANHTQSGVLCTTVSMTNGNTPMASTKRLLIRSQPNGNSNPPTVTMKLNNPTSSQSPQCPFPDPMIGAPPGIVSKVSLIQSMEADTVRWEKARAFKKRLKAIREQQS